MSQYSVSDAETDNADDVSEAETIILDRSWNRRVIPDDHDAPPLQQSAKSDKPVDHQSPPPPPPKPAHPIAKKKKRDASGRMLLQKLCDKGDYNGAAELLKQGVDVNDRDYAGNTALHDAALKGHYDIVELLLDNGAEIDVRSGATDLDTPLIDAASHSHVSIVKLLLDRGADPLIYNAQGKTALDFVDQDDSDGEQVESLIKEAIVDFRAKFGKSRRNTSTPDGGDESSSGDSAHASSNSHLKHDQESSSAGPSNGMGPKSLSSDGSLNGHRNNHSSRRGARAQSIRNDLLWMDLTTKTGRDQVYKKAADGDVQFVGRSLEEGWQPDADCLAMAARHGHLDVVNLLLAFGVAPDDLTSKRVTALHETIGRGHVAVIKLLLDGGANPNWKDPNGKSYLELARELLPDDDEEVILLQEAMRSAPSRPSPIVSPYSSPRKSKSVKLEKSSSLPPEQTKPKPSTGPSDSRKESHTKLSDKRRTVSVSDKVISAHQKEDAIKHRVASAPVKASIEKPPRIVTIVTKTPNVEKHKDSSEPEVPAKRPKLEKKESARKLLELQQQREKERKQREKEMLRNLELQEQQRKERKGQEEVRSASTSANVSGASSPTPSDQHVQHTTTDHDQLLYLPLMVRQTANGAGFILDAQISRLMGVPNVFSKQPSLSRKLVTFNEKERLWTLVSSWLFPINEAERRSMSLKQAYELRLRNRAKFMDTPLFWVRINEVFNFLQTYSPDLYALCSTNTVLIDLDYADQDQEQQQQTRYRQSLHSYPSNLPPRLRGKLIAQDRMAGWY